jgi:hypothetical protein
MAKWTRRNAQRANIGEALECAKQAADAHARWGATESIKRRGARLIGDHQEVVQPCALLDRWDRSQCPIETGGGALTHTSDQTGQGGDPRQQDLVVDQPGDRDIEHHGRPFGADPGTGVEPAHQLEMTRLISEITIAVALPNFAGVQPA